MKASWDSTVWKLHVAVHRLAADGLWPLAQAEKDREWVRPGQIGGKDGADLCGVELNTQITLGEKSKFFLYILQAILIPYWHAGCSKDSLRGTAPCKLALDRILLLF